MGILITLTIAGASSGPSWGWAAALAPIALLAQSSAAIRWRGDRITPAMAHGGPALAAPTVIRENLR